MECKSLKSFLFVNVLFPNSLISVVLQTGTVCASYTELHTNALNQSFFARLQNIQT